MKIGVLGFVNHTHPAPAEFLEDAVVRDGLANHGAETGAILGRTHSLVNWHPPPLAAHGPAMIAPQIHREDCHANKHRTANDQPLGQVGIHNCIESTHQKRSVGGFDACASLKPRFSNGERARRPRNQFDDDGVDKRGDVQCSQKRAAARHCPAQHHPDAPKQVQEQDGFRENRCRKNRTITPRCWLLVMMVMLRYFPIFWACNLKPAAINQSLNFCLH